MISVHEHNKNDTVFPPLLYVTVDGKDVKHFKELVQRGANLWPDAPASIKTLADLVTTGKVLQDYKDDPVKVTAVQQTGVHYGT